MKTCPREWTHRPGTFCSTCGTLIPGEPSKTPPFAKKPPKEKR